jgi:hypothetical protein
MERERDLAWDGCLNARDLGGLRAGTGGGPARAIRRGAVVRSDNPAHLTSAGWAALAAYGIRTIVALRTAGTNDVEPDASAVPAGVALVRVVLEDLGDADFVRRCVATRLWETPLYFPDVLARWPDRCAAAVAAVAHAHPGGVVVSCGRGCDRTGLVSFLLLALAGVAADDIAADWEKSLVRLRLREPALAADVAEILRREKTTVRASIAQTLASTDVEVVLRRGGLAGADLDAVRARLLVTAD